MIAAVILAAGRSQRMGQPKMSLPWKDGNPIIAHMVSIFELGGADPIFVVVGKRSGELTRHLRDTAAKVLVCPDEVEAEMVDSVKVGIRALAGSSARAALIMPGDHPRLLPATVRALCEAWKHKPDAIYAPSFQGRRGHPLLVPARIWPELLALGEGQSIRHLLKKHEQEIAYLIVKDAGVCLDMDTPEDYERALEG